MPRDHFAKFWELCDKLVSGRFKNRNEAITFF